jgi:hypothetical protein
MNDHELVAKFAHLYPDRDDFPYLLAKRPVFAHYTSIESLEKIMRSEEVWFSNPLFMTRECRVLGYFPAARDVRS